MMLCTVSRNPSFFITAGWPGSVPIVLTACDVCTTHTGLLMIVVAEPAYLNQWESRDKTKKYITDQRLNPLTSIPEYSALSPHF